MKAIVKKLMVMLLAFTLMLGCFAGCGDSKEEDKDSAPKKESIANESADEAVESADVESAGQEESVITDESGESDKGPRPDRPDKEDISQEESGDIADESGEVDNDPRPDKDGVASMPRDRDIKADPIDSYFDNSVFIGYSIMMHFGRYVGEWRQEVDESIMGTALWCAGVSMGFTTDRIQTPETPDNALPLFQGQAYNFADLPAATGCDTLYIGLSGYSDLKRAPDDEYCVYMAYNEAVMGIERIQKKNPDLKIVILSCTYNTAVYEGLTPTRCRNDQVLEYNNLVLDYCTEKGIDFIDVSTMLTDKNGLLIEDFTNDGEYHLEKNVYYLWIKALRDYAAKKQDGTWVNLTDMPNLPAF